MTVALEDLTAEGLAELVGSGPFKRFKVAVTDIDGVLRGECLRRDEAGLALASSSLWAWCWAGTQTTRCRAKA